MTESTETFYEVLNSTESSTYEEIKENYRKLVLQHHPDKTPQTSTSSKFIKIEEAWKLLRTPHSRKIYDSELAQKRGDKNFLVYAELNLNELKFDDNISYYPCRCGYSYVINKNEIVEKTAIECEECSNVIVINI